MKKNYKTKISFFVVVLFLMNTLFGGPFSLRVQAEESIVKITKNINKTSVMPEEEIDVTLNVKGKPPVNVVKPNDVILIVDKSGSMRGEKIQDAKAAAKSFIDLMDMTKHRVGIVDFSSVIDSIPLTDNAQEAKNYIDKIRDGGATYTGSAVRRAKQLLANHRPDAQPVIVIMTDGAANYGGSEEAGFNDAKAAAKEAKDAGIVFYTIALLDSRDNPAKSPQNAVLKEMATTAQHHHFVLGSVGLEEIYKGIVKEIGIASAYDVNIKDVVSPEFEIVPGSYDSNIPKPQVNGNEVSWHLTELKDQELTFNYKIRAKKDTKLGTYPVASESKIEYKDFIGSKQTLNINKPSVTLEYPAPKITEVLPNYGEVTGGNEITIKGINFKPEAKVYFENVLGSNIRVINENEIKVVVPPAVAEKTATLKVENKDGKYATSTYKYWVKASVRSITPNKGPVKGNTVVTIRGDHFVNGINVKFGNKPAKKVIYKNPTLIYAVTDAADKEGIVDVILNNEDIAKTEIVVKDGFTFEGEKVLPPVVSAIAPSEGYTDEAKTVKITGENFKDGAKVKIGDKEATNVKVENNTTITATVPTVDVPEVVDVKVINADSQEGKLQKAYKYIEKPMLVPTIDSIKPNCCYINETQKVTIVGSQFQKGAKVYIGGVEATDVDSSNSDYIYATVPAKDTPSTADVKVVNPNGKEVTLIDGFTYKDTPGPEITSITPNEGIYNEEKKISISVKNLESGAKVKIGDKDPLETTVYSSYIYVKIPAADAPKSVDITVINPDGKEAKVANGYTYKPQPEKPAPTISNLNLNWCYIKETKNIIINGTNFQSGAKVYIGGVEATGVDSSCSSNYIYATVPVSNIPSTVDVKVINPDGKEVVLTGGFTYKDTPGPEITSITPNEGIYNEEKKINISVKNLESGAKVKIGDKDPLETTVYSSYIYVKIPAADAPKSVDITVINPDGKEAKLANGYTYKPIPEKPAPTISNLNLNWCYIKETKNIIINGTNFQSGAKVYIGGVEATGVNSSNATYIYATVPAKDTPATVDVKVVNPDGKEVVLTGGFTYKPEPEKPAPTISSVKENWCYIGTTKRVAINGSNFQKGAKVYIDGVEATAVDSTYSTYIYATVPAKDTPSTVDVKVVNPDGKEVVLTGGFTYKDTPGPEITCISPNEGIYNEEKKIAIYGNNFKTGVKVKIGDKDALETTLCGTYLYVKIPAADAPKSVDVTIINPDGKEAKVVNGYTYKPIPEKPAPTIKEITPNSGLINTSKNISIYGQNFQNGITAKFGDVEAKVQYMDSAYISIAVPQRSTAGAVDVTLTNPDGKNVVLVGGYSYTIPQMTISSLSPNHGKLEGGYCVGIYGTNFAKDSEIYVDGKKVDNIEYSNSTLIYITKMPAGVTDGQVDVEVRSASLGQSKTIKFTYDPKPIIPPPTINSYSSYTIFGQNKLDIYGYNLSKNMVLRNVATGEEFICLAPGTTYVTFKMPDSYRGQKVTCVLVNKDENKESAPYEFQIK